MQWALVLYSLTFIHGDGRPMVSTFHPKDTEALCRAAEEMGRDTLKKRGYIGICQNFQVGSTPNWPWRADWRTIPPRKRAS